VSKFLKQAINKQQVTIYGEGKQTRTFCYIDDNLDSTVACLQRNLCFNDVMNVGSDEEISVLELAQKIISLSNSSSTIQFLPALTEGDMARRKPDNSKMKSILARPLTSLEDGIKRTLDKRMF
jgi:UDP-glucose 4-epimerase